MLSRVLVTIALVACALAVPMADRREVGTEGEREIM